MPPSSVLAGRYELRGRIGRGGMGEVWSGLDLVLRRDIAIKTVALDGADDPATRERFAREAMATAALSHAHIVTIFDAGIDGETAYLVMELLPGPTLNALVAQHGALSVSQAATYGSQAADALSASHALGIIHRDVKPTNLMLDAHGRLKILDFGIARLSQSQASRLTASATALGSAPYISPEQARGDDASGASDVYALGCVMTTLLTGEPPFNGDNPMALVHQHVSTPPPRLRERRADAPAELESLVDSMLAKDPRLRPTADQVRARLHTLAESGRSQAGPGIGSTQMLAAPSNSVPRRRRPVVLLALAALLAVVVVAVLGWVLIDRDDSTASTSGPGGRSGPGAGTSGPPAESTSPSTSTPTTTTTPSEETTPSSVVTDDVTAAVAALRSAVEAVPDSEEHGSKARDDLLNDLDKIDDAVEHDDAKDLDKAIEGFARTLEHLSDKDEIDDASEELVAAALSDLVAVAPDPDVE